MLRLKQAMCASFVMVALPGAVFAIILQNGSFEFGPGPTGADPFVPANWTELGPTAERSAEANLTPAGPGHALKAFGSQVPEDGAYQQVPAAPGNMVTITASLFTEEDDEVGGGAEAGIVLEFYSASDPDNPLASAELFPLNAASPAETWIPASVGPIMAPPGTAFARFVCEWRSNVGPTGAAFWDGCTLSINGSANLLLNGNFETAGMGMQSAGGLDFWMGFNDQEKSAEVAYEGNFSVKLGDNAAFSGVFQDVGQVSGGDRICMTARGLHREADGLQGATQVGIKMEFEGSGPAAPAEENLEFNADTAADTWLPVELNTVVPPGMGIARVVCIWAPAGVASGAAYFDVAEAFRGSAPGFNQLLNPSFEMGFGGFNGITNWTEFSAPGQSQAQASVGEVPPVDGFRTMKATGTSFAGIFQEIQVTPGETLDLSVMMRTPSDNHIMNATAGIKVEWFPGTLPADIENFLLNAGTPTDTWIPIKIDFTMPEGTAATLRYTVLYFRGNGSGNAFIDACSLVVNVNGDANADEHVDLRDAAFFQTCFSGTGMHVGGSCGNLDSDCDEDIDLVDYQAFHGELTGP